MIELTGLANPNSDKKMLNWLRKNGYPYTSAGKNMVAKALKTAPLTEVAQHVLYIRQEFKKISYHKLEALIQRVSADGRLRDMFAFLGAPRTGRWAGQDVQFQNIARPNKILKRQLRKRRWPVDSTRLDFAGSYRTDSRRSTTVSGRREVQGAVGD